MNYIKQYQKIKELFCYCLVLEKTKNGLESDLEKYRDYKRINKNMKE